MAELKAVVPPLVDASTLVPNVPLVWSQARKVISPVVAFCPLGRNRSMSVLRSSNAELSVTAPTDVQLPPPSVEYCQLPLPLGSRRDGDAFNGARVNVGNAIATGAQYNGRYSLTCIGCLIFSDGGKRHIAAVVQHRRVIDTGYIDSNGIGCGAEGCGATVVVTLAKPPAVPEV